MGILDKFCRFCTRELDILRRRNIFSSENSHLLATAAKCMTLPMSAGDCYPKFICYNCARMLNDIADFQQSGSLAVGFFDQCLYRSNFSTFDPNCHLAAGQFLKDNIPKIELPDSDAEPIIDVQEGEEVVPERVEEVVPERVEEVVPERVEEVVPERVEEVVPSDGNCRPTAERPKEFRKCMVRLTRYDDVLPLHKKPTREESSSSAVEANNSTETPNLLDIMRLSKKRLYHCQHCKLGFRLKSLYDSHMLVHVNDEPLQATSTPNPDGGERFPCENCNKTFSEMRKLVRHRRGHRTYKPLQCHMCLFKCRHRYELRRHHLTHFCFKPLLMINRLEGAVNKEIANGDKLFSCKYCSKVFKHPSRLLRHALQHIPEKPFKCTFCVKSYRRKSNLSKHLASHSAT